MKKRVNIVANGKLRNLLSIKESPKGDVYIRLKSGRQVGIPPNEIKISEHRYSIHVSPRSANYTTLKRTLQLEGGQSSTGCALTDAVKCNNGFSPIFSHRTTDLSGSDYDVKNDNTDSILLKSFDPEKEGLVFTIFVGNPEENFLKQSDNAIIAKFNTKNFQFIICYCFIRFSQNLPIPFSLPFAWTMDSITFDPETFNKQSSIYGAHEKMSGDAPQECIKYFCSSKDFLMINLLETHKELSTNVEIKNFFQHMINKISPVPSIHIPC